MRRTTTAISRSLRGKERKKEAGPVDLTGGNSPDAATLGSMLPAVLRRAGHRRQGRIPDGAPAWRMM